MDITEPTSTISTFLKDTLIGEAAREASINNEFPLETAMITTLGLVSHITQIGYCSVFGNKRPLPCGLYVASEQGKGASKSPLFDDIKGDIDDYITRWNAERIKQKQQALKESDKMDDCDIPDLLKKDLMKDEIAIFTSNTTPEALEDRAGKQGGMFSAQSTEKSLLSVLFGDMYGDGKNSDSKNNELVLSGFVGEKPKVLRIGRTGISTRAYGAITVVSQAGTIDKIISASGNSGLSERFLMLVEPRIDKKFLEEMWKKEKDQSNPFLKQLYNVMVKIINNSKSLESLSIDNKAQLVFSKKSIEFIKDYNKQCKLRTFDNEDPFSNELIAGYLLKSDLQIMKIATILHATESLINSNTVPKTINHKYVEMAWSIVFSLMRGIPKLCEELGVIGDDSLIEVICKYLQGKGYRDEKVIYNSVRKNDCFKSLPKGKVKESFDNALSSGVKRGMIKMRGASAGFGSLSVATYSV